MKICALNASGWWREHKSFGHHLCETLGTWIPRYFCNVVPVLGWWKSLNCLYENHLWKCGTVILSSGCHCLDHTLTHVQNFRSGFVGKMFGETGPSFVIAVVQQVGQEVPFCSNIFESALNDLANVPVYIFILTQGQPSLHTIGKILAVVLKTKKKIIFSELTLKFSR